MLSYIITRKTLIVSFLLFFSISSLAIAEEISLESLMKRIEQLEQENLQLKEKMEIENQKLKEDLKEVKDELAAFSDRPAQRVTDYKTSEKTPGLPAVKSEFPLKIFGMVKIDAIYNDSQVGEWGVSAPSEGGGHNDNEFLMAAMWSRIGFMIDGPEIVGGGKTRGLISGDFVKPTPALGDSDRHPGFRLFEGYLDIAYETWSLRAGQTWDFFSPFNPNTFNAGWFERGGNIGYRHPQIVYTYKFKDVADGTLGVQTGIIDTVLLQHDTGFPLWAGYVFYEGDFMGIPFYIGGGGLYGQQRLSATITGYDDVWAATTAFRFKPHDKITITGETFIGQALADFWGGSTTNVITDASGFGKTIRSRGGWVEITFDPLDVLQLNAGAGIDDVLLDGSTPVGAPSSIWDNNYTWYTNFKYKFAKNFIWGIEYQYFRTKFLQSPGGDANRIQSTIIYKF